MPLGVYDVVVTELLFDADGGSSPSQAATDANRHRISRPSSRLRHAGDRPSSEQEDAMSKVTDPEPPPDLARRLVDANVYLTLATADDSGRPWATPVWYAARDCDEFVWVSRPDARHSLNIAARPEVGIVIFDSTVPVGGAAAVYVEAEAEQVGPDDRTNALAIFNGRSEAQELRRGWSPTSSHRRRTGSIERRRDRSTPWTTRTAGFPSPEGCSGAESVSGHELLHQAGATHPQR